MTLDSSLEQSSNSNMFNDKLMDVLFIIDATGSMSAALAAAHDRAASIATKLKFTHPNLDFQFGAICYRDPIDSPSDIHAHIDLNPNINNMVQFLSRQHASGGGDYPEDWVGAFNIALDKISWRNGARMSIIIADAPAHGSTFCGSYNHEDQNDLLGPLVIEFARRNILISGLSLNKGADYTFHALQRLYEAANGPKFTFESFQVGYNGHTSKIVKRDQLGRDINDSDYPKDDPDDEQYDCDCDIDGIPPRKTRPPPIDDSVDKCEISSTVVAGSAEEILASKLTDATSDLVVAALKKAD
ncbi:hypothetical protein TRFO_42994 [Tritrichomonas foetus]|uniref:Hemicentin-1-like von Willebrand factor A domain-containing protein n=1 Tax=Tritrichomonas foetus TaxID=1144522 RepID=A0A1J4KTD0_9EUKA|nr:hypothetical protein TRFO_42994 [Tritrichomonas foetus]|eukprot:OHT14551.1 hypothetical protein TRFO_42994 [Tritrichomonas foetus]